MRAPGQVAVAAGSPPSARAILWGSFYLPTGGGYAQVGRACAANRRHLIVLLGALLLREAFTGGFRGVDEEAEVHMPMDWPASRGCPAASSRTAAGRALGFVFASRILFVHGGARLQQPALAAQHGHRLILAIVFAIFNYGSASRCPGILRRIL
jgi:putative tricarboxylic transport membrane protein